MRKAAEPFGWKLNFNQRPVSAGVKGDATHERAEHEYRVRVKGLLRNDGGACAGAHSELAAGLAGGGGDAISGPRQVATPGGVRAGAPGLPQWLWQAPARGAHRGHDHGAPAPDGQSPPAA